MKKVIDIEERIPSMREKRRKRTNRKFILILSIFITALLVILYFQSPFSRIDKVEISGAKLHENKYYEEASGMMKDNSFWGFSVKSIEKKLEGIDVVKDVSVSRKWFRDIKITIAEWETVAYIEEQDKYDLLLESGDVFPGVEVRPEEKAPVLIGFSNKKNRKKISAQLTDMEKDVYQLISEIILKDKDEKGAELTVYMDDGYEVRAIISTFADQMAYYPEITAQLHGLEKGVIDMEVGTYFTPFSKVYGSKGDEENDEEDE